MQRPLALRCLAATARLLRAIARRPTATATTHLTRCSAIRNLHTSFTMSKSRQPSEVTLATDAHVSIPVEHSRLTSHQKSARKNQPLTAADIRQCDGFIIDMDGVLYYQQKPIPGAIEFIRWLQQQNKSFLFLTNSSERTPRELSEKLSRIMDLDISPSNFYSSALSTATFLSRQKPNGSAYVIGEAGLFSALYDAGYTMNDSNPDYVVVGETRNYHYPMIEHAVDLVRRGARLIGTNVDVADRSADSFVPACGALVKPIEMASGRSAFFLGKPSPLIMRAAIQRLGVKREDAVIIGDRLDTDILAGVQSEIRTVLVLTGVTSLADVAISPYRPDVILPSLGHVLQDGTEETHNVPKAP